jgi:uncharacterized protein (TIRG00374 family)
MKKLLSKKRIIVPLKLAFTGLIFCFLFKEFGHEFKQLASSGIQIQWHYFIFAISALGISQIIAVWRWQICCSTLQIELVKDSTLENETANKNNLANIINPFLFRIYFIGLFWNNVLPGSFSGDLIRGYLLKKDIEHLNIEYKEQKVKLTSCISSVFLDRFFGLLIIVLIGFASCFWIKGLPKEIIQSLTLVFVATLIGLTILFTFNKFFVKLQMAIQRHHGNNFIGRLTHKLIEIVSALNQLMNNRKAFAQVFFSSLIIQLLVTACFFFLSQSLNLKLSNNFVWILNPISSLGTLLVPSINGLGVREGIFAHLFKSLGYPGSEGILLSVSWLLSLIIVSLPGVAFLLFKPELREELKEIQDEEESGELQEVENREIAEQADLELESLASRNRN